MAKKKGKNSNYNGLAKAAEAEAEQARKDKRKNIIITVVCVILLTAFVGGMAMAFLPKIYYVEMDFGNYGKIVIKVDGDAAPKTANNFMKLVNDGFYDGLTIFRAQKDFVIQGGKNDSVNLKPIVGEFSENGYKNDIVHNRGVISMARTNDPDSATSQFFITLHDQAKHSLDGKYAAFGYVIEGMDVVDKIAEALMNCDSDSMGFVSDSDAITIVSAKKIDYKK